MRFWLDPNALATRGVTINDVGTAIRSQNVVLGGGTIEAEPAPRGQQYQIPLNLQGQFTGVADAENIVIKTASNGLLIKLGDVDRAELGAQNYGSSTNINGKPGVALGVYQLPGSNALDVAKQVESRIEELKQSFPPGIAAELVYDTVSFIEESNKEVLITLLEAIGLVVLVSFIFLQNWRATIIPTIAIPVSRFRPILMISIAALVVETRFLKNPKGPNKPPPSSPAAESDTASDGKIAAEMSRRNSPDKIIRKNRPSC